MLLFAGLAVPTWNHEIFSENDIFNHICLRISNFVPISFVQCLVNNASPAGGNCQRGAQHHERSPSNG